MSWPLPLPSDIADRASSGFEASFAALYAQKNPTLPAIQVDARSPNSNLAIIAREMGLTAFDLYLYQSNLAQELMPDTAVRWLSRQGTIWGVPQDQPTGASGNATAVGTPDLVIPAYFQMTSPGGALYQTTEEFTLDGTGNGDVPVAAVATGSVTNLASGVVLTAVNPLAELNPQTMTVDSNGLTGGTDLESADSWRSRILARIRQRGSGGDGNDYLQWTQEVLPGALVNAYSPTPGEVVVAIAMPTSTGVRVPTSAELTTATAYLTDAMNRKPLACLVTVIAATLQPVPVTIHLNPDTVATRAAATNALTLYFISDMTINSTLYVSRLDNALSVGDGEYSHERTLPAADVVPSTISSILTFGTLTFV